MGGFRMRKSIRVAPGVRLNVSKRGVGASVGAGPVRYSVHSTGRRTTTVRSGVPGVYYQSSQSGSRTRSSAPRTTAAAVSPVRQPPKPGLFAPKGEKQLFKAWEAQDAVAVYSVGEQYPEMMLPGFTLAGLMLAPEDGAKARDLLARAFADGQDASETRFFTRYLAGVSANVGIADGVVASAPLGRDAVGLALAELYQADGDLDDAIDVVEQLEPTTYTAVSLAELYAQAGRFDDVVELTEGVQNADDASALLLVFRGVAFREQGYFDAAHESFKEALRARSRAAEVRHYALLERSANYERQGKKAMARKDLERILAEDSDYPDVRERLQASQQ